MSMFKGFFLVLRLPLIILTMLGLLSGLGFAGWRIYYGGDLYGDPAETIRQRMQRRIADLESYHVRFKTVAWGEKKDSACSIEIWKDAHQRYRLEITAFEEGEQSSVEVIIDDGERVYFYDAKRGEFLPVEDPAAAGINTASLEEYWLSVSESACFNYLNEEGGSRHSYYLVEIIPAEPYRYRVSERLWLEKRSSLPVRIESFDMAGCLTQVTVFELLQLNPMLESALFDVDAAVPGAYSP